MAHGVPDEEVDQQLMRLNCQNFSLSPDSLGSLSASGGLRLDLSGDGPSVGSSAEVPECSLAIALLPEVAPVAEDVLTAGNDDEDIDICQLLALQDEEAELSPVGFCISTTQNGACKRLHFVGGCHRVPGEHYKNFKSFGQEVPAEHLYNFRCKDCFPADRAAARAAEAQVEASSVDGSSSGESAISAAAPLDVATP